MHITCKTVSRIGRSNALNVRMLQGFDFLSRARKKVGLLCKLGAEYRRHEGNE